MSDYWHKQLYAKYGKASQYNCSDCDAQAQEWSWIHGCDRSDIDNSYEPRCISCHRKYDESGNNLADSHIGNKNSLGHRHTVESRSKMSIAQLSRTDDQKCEPGCTCDRHINWWTKGGSSKCEPGCACGKHKYNNHSKKCQPGCLCGRHFSDEWNRHG